MNMKKIVFGADHAGYAYKNEQNLAFDVFMMIIVIIAGFILGSIPALIPNLSFSKDAFIGILTMIISFILSYKLIKQD